MIKGWGYEWTKKERLYLYISDEKLVVVLAKRSNNVFWVL